MSLLGFDASGRMALGQLPASRYLVLIAVQGMCTVTGHAASLKVGEAWLKRDPSSGIWSAAAKEAEAWTPAIKQPETWIPE